MGIQAACGTKGTKDGLILALNHKPVNNFETNEDILMKFFGVDPQDFQLMNIDRFEKKTWSLPF